MNVLPNQHGISQMIDLIETHFDQSIFTKRRELIVGGVVGTDIFDYAIQAVTMHYPFDRVLVVEGCQDYIGLLRKPVLNYRFYLDLFRTIPVYPQKGDFEFVYVPPKPDYIPRLEKSLFQGYDALVVNNAQLIPRLWLDAFTNYFPGQVLLIVDPLDKNGLQYQDVPTLTDSLSKQSPLNAYARSLFNIESRALDSKIKTVFKKIKMTKRSIGKIDSNQYVTNDDLILKSVRDKQYRARPRRNQKFMVMNEDVQFFTDKAGAPVTVGPGCLLSMASVTKPLYTLRIHSSSRLIHTDLSYRSPDRCLYVKPANILSCDEAYHHRFLSLVVVLGEEPMSTVEWYSLLKITNAIQIVEY